MKNLQTTWPVIALILGIAFILHAQTNNATPIYGTFFLQSHNSAPYPFDPYDGTEPISVLDASNHIYLIQDNADDFATLTEINSLSRMTMSSEGPPGFDEIGGGGYTNSYFGSSFSIDTNLLWLEVNLIPDTNNSANSYYLLTAHQTVGGENYQLLSKTNLLQPNWKPWPILAGSSGTNQTDFPGIYVSQAEYPNNFFRAHHAGAVVLIGAGQENAYEPNALHAGQTGSFNFVANGLTNDVTVYFTISGTAQNGVDYSNIPTQIVLTNSGGNGYGTIEIQPVQDNLMEGMETVTLTLADDPDYLINDQLNQATINISDSSTVVAIYEDSSGPAIEPNGPPGTPAKTNTFMLLRTDWTYDYPPMSVWYEVSGTASNGVDYVLLNGSVSFASGNSVAYLDVVPLQDNFPDDLESVTLTLMLTNTYLVDTNAYTATTLITDSSTTVSMGVFSKNAIEPDGPPGAPGVTASFWVHRSDTRGISTNLTVRYAVSGTASNGVDYVSLNGVVTFAPGLDDTNIVVTPLADSVLEGIETVTVTLLDLATNGYFIDTNNATGTVLITDSSTVLSISAGTNAVEPYPSNSIAGQNGNFQISRADPRGIYPSLTIYYQISGSASNGVDYTNLTGTVTMPAGVTSNNIYVQPIADNLFEGDESVVLTLLPTQAYVVSTINPSAIIAILDSPVTNRFVLVASISQPIGIDYHAPSNSIIVSSTTGGKFWQIYTNLILSNSVVVTNVVITNWSGIHGLDEEMKLAVVKTNLSGFTNGDLYFGSGAAIGKLSANGSVSNLNWCVLTNDTVQNGLPLRGSLYVDQTGIFSNNVIAVASGGGTSISGKGVWRVDAQAHPILLTNLLTAHLEGVITLPNDTNKWGPWAGKIITGDELFSPPPIYAIDSTGSVTAFDTTKFFPGGIRTEDFDMIPPNQSLYACDPGANCVVKFSADYLTNYVGELLITEAGENGFPSGKLFVIHWDTVSSNFVARRFQYKHPDGTDGVFEHVTFAPIELPKQ